MTDEDFFASITSLVAQHNWVACSSMIIGLLMRLCKRDVPFFPDIDARWRAFAAVILGIIDGVLHKVIAGGTWGPAIAGGLFAAFMAISSHDVVIEGFRKGRELFQKRPGSAGPGGPPGPGEQDVLRESRRPPPEVVLEAFKLPAPSKSPIIKLAQLALVSVLLLPGCASVLPALTQVLTVVSDASQILGAIEAAEEVWFASHPQPDAQAKVDRAIADARLALVTALRATQGVKNLSEEDTDAAFAEFRVAYAALDALLKEIGIVHAGGKMSLARGELSLPDPLAMRRH